MILYDFECERPRTLSEAAAFLAQLGDGARLMAGGTDLLPNMRLEIVRPATVVSLKEIAPEPISADSDGSIRIDALTSLATLAKSDLVKAELPMLAESARAVGSSQVREMGTIGGNLCQDTRCLYLNQKHDYQFKTPCFKRGGNCCYPFPRNDPDTCWSVHMSDTAPALIALDAEVETVRPNGGRHLLVQDLFTGDGLRPVQLEPDEIIRAIIIPRSKAAFGWGYHKSSRRGGLEYGLAVMAVTLFFERNGSACSDARIVIGAVREKPTRVHSGEQTLIGTMLDDDLLAKVASLVAEEVKPLPHHGFTKSFLTDNIRVHLRRALLRARAVRA